MQLRDFELDGGQLRWRDDAVRKGASIPKEIVARAYLDVSPKAHAMAERAVLAHLEKLEADGLVVRDAGGSYGVSEAQP